MKSSGTQDYIYMLAGDEETFPIMYHLIRSNPRQYHWLIKHLGN